MTTLNTIHRVYTMTPKGSFSLRYEGEDEMKALTAYNKLCDADKPRCWTTNIGNSSSVRMRNESFPQ